MHCWDCSEALVSQLGSRSITERIAPFAPTLLTKTNSLVRFELLSSNADMTGDGISNAVLAKYDDNKTKNMMWGLSCWTAILAMADIDVSDAVSAKGDNKDK